MLTIEKPPLKSFRIDFKFKRPEKISFNMMAKVEDLLKKEYPNAPSLDLIEYSFDIDKIAKVPIQIGPIRFLNNEKNGQIQFFSDGFIFLFTEYSHWKEIKDLILNLVLDSCKILQINNIEQFRLEYIDEFSLPKKNFDLEKYFNLYVINPEKWSINFNDFHTGIKINTQEDDKFIIKLRGLSPKKEDSFLFRFESIYVKKKTYLIENKQIIMDDLNTVHDIIIEYFLSVMSENLKKILGVKFID